MKKEKVVVNVTIFLMCIVLTCVMSMQFKTARQTNLTDIKNMNEDELKSEIVVWQKKYNEISKKLENVKGTIEEYQSILQNNQETSKVLDKELNNLEKLVGVTDVQGDGVVLTLEDNEEQGITASTLLNLVNELKYAGAEAISINNIRIVNSTDIVDVNYIIQIEGQKISSPYIVKCIGNQEYLSNNLNAKDAYLHTYTESGISVKMELQNNIKIEKYSGDLEVKYSKN